MAYKLPGFLYAVGNLHDCSLTLHMGYNSLEVKEYQVLSVSLFFLHLEETGTHHTQVHRHSRNKHYY